MKPWKSLKKKDAESNRKISQLLLKLHRLYRSYRFHQESGNNLSAKILFSRYRQSWL